jgi:TatD DNase family protein
MMSHPYFNVHSHHHDNKNLTIFQASSILEDCWFSFGIHPWEANSNIDFSMFHEILKHQNCLATGEIGLDRLKGKDLSKQLEIFTKQIELSEELQLPVIIHCVKAWNELKKLKRAIKPTQNWIYHGFSKTNILEDVISEGLFVSFGAAILRNPKLMEASTNVPLEKLFLETDDSTISIEIIYSKFAIAKQITLQELKEIQFSNLKRVFKKWKSG